MGGDRTLILQYGCPGATEQQSGSRPDFFDRSLIADARLLTACRVGRFIEFDDLKLQRGASAIHRQYIHRRSNLIASIIRNGMTPMAPINSQTSIGNGATLKIDPAAGTVSTATRSEERRVGKECRS